MMRLRIEIRGRRAESEVAEMIRGVRIDNSIDGWMYSCENIARKLHCFVYFHVGTRADLEGHEMVAVFHGGVNL